MSSAPWAAVIGADLTVLTPRRRWLCLQYLGYQSLGPLLEWRLNDRHVAETVSWATPGDRPDTLHWSRSVHEVDDSTPPESGCSGRSDLGLGAAGATHGRGSALYIA